jgi:radical SAM protein with 4Fe4S-binding SPASM domain
VIEPDGSLNNCPDKSSFEPAYSTIEQGVQAFANSPMRKKWIRIQQVGHRIHDCATCENNIWCKSGCPITPNANPHHDEHECSGYKQFINHVRQHLSNSETLALFTDYHQQVLSPNPEQQAAANAMTS